MYKQNITKTEGLVNHDLKGMNVTIVTKTDKVNGQVLHGDAVLNAERRRFEFFQRTRPIHRNPVLARSMHMTFRQMRDGRVRTTILFEPQKRYIMQELIEEFRDGFTSMKEVEE